MHQNSIWYSRNSPRKYTNMKRSSFHNIHKTIASWNLENSNWLQSRHLLLQCALLAVAIKDQIKRLSPVETHSRKTWQQCNGCIQISEIASYLQVLTSRQFSVFRCHKKQILSATLCMCIGFTLINLRVGLQLQNSWNHNISPLSPWKEKAI